MILTQINRKEFVQKSIRNAAVIVYSFLSEVGSCRRIELISELARNLPSDFDRNTLGPLIDEILHYGEQRGDFCYLKGRRVQILPSYIISQTDKPEFRIYGHWGIHPLLQETTEQLKGQFRKSLIIDDMTGVDLVEFSKGLEITLEIPLNKRSEFLKLLQNNQIKYIDLNILATQIPGINELEVPADEDLGNIQERKDWVWEYYDSRSEIPFHEGRWGKINGPSGWQMLIRRTPPKADFERDNRNYFFMVSPGRGIELNREDSLLWQFKLAYESHNLVNFSYKRTSLWFNGWLPFSIFQWLSLQTNSGPLRVEMQGNFPIDPSKLPEVEAVLETKLGVKVEKL